MIPGREKNWYNYGVENGWIETYEQEAVRFMEQEFGELSSEEKCCLVFTSLFLKAGHTSLPLSLSPIQWAGFLDAGKDTGPDLPSEPFDETSFRESRIISGDRGVTPLVLENRMISFRKHRSREKELLDWLIEKNSTEAAPLITSLQISTLDNLFRDSSEQPDWQKAAAAMSLIKPFLIISGGPGTGKTTTVARILALHQRLHGHSLRIALAAPTGKAAGRMGEALQKELKKLVLTDDELKHYPQEAKTVHRLLAGTQSRGLLPPVEKKRLRYDLIIVDEASMIDLTLMHRLVSHLGEDTKLILLGDKDQLASVEAGSVFADLCRKSENAFSRNTVNLLHQLGMDDKFEATTPSLIDDSIVYLTKSYRFGAESGIGRLASVVNRGEPILEKAEHVFEEFPELEHKRFHYHPDELTGILDRLVEKLLTAGEFQTPEDLLNCWKEAAWLSVLRHGLTGTNRLNQLIEQRIARQRAVRITDGWYHGRPVIITQNDYHLGIFNGDMGVCMGDQQGNMWVYVESGSQVRRINPKRLVNYNPAYFLTVHKSQGSEFEQVNLLLPQKDTPILTRELIYTAITRARKRFSLYGDMDLFEKGISRKTERFTGLQHLIQNI